MQLVHRSTKVLAQARGRVEERFGLGETQSSSGIECTTGLSVALRLSRRTTEIARPGRIGARLRDDAGRLSSCRALVSSKILSHSVGSIGSESGIQAHLGPILAPAAIGVLSGQKLIM